MGAGIQNWNINRRREMEHGKQMGNGTGKKKGKWNDIVEMRNPRKK